MTEKLKVKIQIKGSSKEYTVEIADKSKFLEEIKLITKENGIFEFSDDEGDYGIFGSAISSIEFIDNKGETKAGF
tara:strand:- start:546 stop:770 length:225 start_codon:yes stop_codon:yes gene_type:complete